jgi:hypothetical protein
MLCLEKDTLYLLTYANESLEALREDLIECLRLNFERLDEDIDIVNTLFRYLTDTNQSNTNHTSLLSNTLNRFLTRSL